MEGLPIDVILVVCVGLAAGLSIVIWISRKLGATQGSALNEGSRADQGNDEGTAISASTPSPAPGRHARHPGGECPICLTTDVETPVQTNCGHWYCARCILEYYEGLGRVRIKCPLCRQEVTMLHLGATEDSENESAGPTATASSAVPDMTLTRQEIARFNQRNSGRRRTPWQVIEDAPLLLRRLWCDVRAGDTRIFGEMIRRGVQLQLAVAALYIISPFDIMPESFLGIAGLVDDFVVVMIFFIYITTVYRTILLSWDRARVARAATAAAAAAAGASPATAPASSDAAVPSATPAENVGSNAPPAMSTASTQGGGLTGAASGAGNAAFFAVIVAVMATSAGAGAEIVAVAAVLMGIAAAASSSNARAIPQHLTGDW